MSCCRNAAQVPRRALWLLGRSVRRHRLCHGGRLCQRLSQAAMRPDKTRMSSSRAEFGAHHGPYLPTARTALSSNMAFILSHGPGLKAGYRRPVDRLGLRTLDQRGAARLSSAQHRAAGTMPRRAAARLPRRYRAHRRPRCRLTGLGVGHGGGWLERPCLDAKARHVRRLHAGLRTKRLKI